jgi:hypothetical protein
LETQPKWHQKTGMTKSKTFSFWTGVSPSVSKVEISAFVSFHFFGRHCSFSEKANLETSYCFGGE